MGERSPLLSIIDVLLLRFLPLWSPKARNVQSCFFTPKTMSCPLGCCLLLWSSLDPSLQSVVLLIKQSIIAKHLGKSLGHSLSQPPLRNTCGPVTSMAHSFSSKHFQNSTARILRQTPRNLLSRMEICTGLVYKMPTASCDSESSGDQGKVSALGGGRSHVQIVMEDTRTSYGGSSQAG